MRRLLFALHFLYSTGFNLVFRILPAYLATFIDSAFTIGLVQVAYIAPQAFALIWGYLSDRIGKARVALFVFLFVSVIASTMVFATDILHYAIAFFFMGIIAGFYYPTINALISLTFEKKRQSLFRLEAAYQVGLITGPIIGGVIASQFGFWSAFLAWSLLSFIAFLITLSMNARGFGKKVSSTYKGIRRSLKGKKSKIALFLIVGSLFAGFFVSIFDLAIPLYAVHSGMGLAEVGMLIGIAAVINVIGMSFLSSTFERIGEKKAMLLGLLMVAIPMLLFSFFTELIPLAILMGIAVTGRAAGLNNARAYVGQVVGPHLRATGMAASHTMHSIGRVIGPIFAGLVIDFFVIAWVFQATAAVAIIGILALLVYSARMR